MALSNLMRSISHGAKRELRCAAAAFSRLHGFIRHSPNNDIMSLEHNLSQNLPIRAHAYCIPDAFREYYIVKVVLGRSCFHYVTAKMKKKKERKHKSHILTFTRRNSCSPTFSNHIGATIDFFPPNLITDLLRKHKIKSISPYFSLRHKKKSTEANTSKHFEIVRNPFKAVSPHLTLFFHTAAASNTPATLLSNNSAAAAAATARIVQWRRSNGNRLPSKTISFTSK